MVIILLIEFYCFLSSFNRLFVKHACAVDREIFKVYAFVAINTSFYR